MVFWYYKRKLQHLRYLVQQFIANTRLLIHSSLFQNDSSTVDSGQDDPDNYCQW